MGKKSHIYLDMSVINFLLADDAPDLKKITVDFFENFIKPGIYNSVISELVIQEINQTRNGDKRMQLLEFVEIYFLGFLEISNEEEVNTLAQLYLEKNIIPRNKVADALHTAMCFVSQIDYLVSWNYKHLANINRERRILAVNAENNYIHPLRIITPLELMNYEN